MHSPKAGLVLVWEFRVRKGCEAAFEAAYGPAGAWAELFSTAHGYLGTELLRDDQVPRRYLTLDRWTSADAFDRFLHDHRAAYAELDAQCESWTEEEHRLGAFTPLRR